MAVFTYLDIDTVTIGFRRVQGIAVFSLGLILRGTIPAVMLNLFYRTPLGYCNY